MQSCVACICHPFLEHVQLCSFLKMATSGVESDLIQCLWEVYQLDFILMNSKYKLQSEATSSSAAPSSPYNVLVQFKWLIWALLT